jgi:ADP-ribosylglycohydrolase
MAKQTRKIDRDRARGCLLGLAIGDALGATLEFEQPPERGFSPLLDGPHVDITGGGPLKLPPYATTDDTAMAACLAASLMKRRRLDVKDVAAAYARWAVDAPDVGNQTREVLHRLRSGVPVSRAAAEIWRENDGRSAPNGALMRTAPIGVAFALRPMEELVAVAADEAAITHWDPRCQLASAAFDAAISAALSSGATPDPHDLRGAASDCFPYSVSHAIKRQVDLTAHAAACEDISSDLKAATQKNPDLYTPDLHLHRHQGFVRVAFRLAFWELFHAPSFEAALIDVVNHGGDADTNGAITGALLGAFYGESAIPQRWAEPMLRAHTGETKGTSTDLGKLLALADWCAEHGGL